MACGSVVRLQHLQTRLFLHSHKFTSPLSGNQEVSCFGDGNTGDSGNCYGVCVSVCVYVCACVCMCVRVCVRACVRVPIIVGVDKSLTSQHGDCLCHNLLRSSQLAVVGEAVY